MIILVLDVSIDRILEFTRAPMHAPTNLLFRQGSEEALHEIQPGRPSRREVDMKPRVPEEPWPRMSGA